MNQKSRILTAIALLILATLVLLNSRSAGSQVHDQLPNQGPTPPAPLFVDPNYHGSCDPEIIWNEAQGFWYIYYTARKGNQQNTWLGTPIGVIRSRDFVHWKFMGYCLFDGKGGSKDAPATWWAPAVVSHNDTLHMFATFKTGTLPRKGPWGGPGKIVHYKAPEKDPVEGWQKVGDMHGDSLITIDATVYRKGDAFHLWFKGKAKGQKKNELYHYISQNTYNWKSKGFTRSDVFNPSVTGSGFEEAPYIFQWKDTYWLITDPHQGLFVYSSQNAQDWNYRNTIMQEGSSRKLDDTRARHASVAVVDGRAFIFYHVEPWRDYSRAPYKQKPKNRRSALQMAELKIQNGKIAVERQQVILPNNLLPKKFIE